DRINPTAAFTALQPTEQPAFRLIAAGTPAPDASALSAAEASVDDPTSAASAPEATPMPASTATTVTTLRRWDTSSASVQVEPLLVGQLDQALAGVEGSVSIAVKDLGSGRGAVLDGSREMQAASLFKLPVLYAVFEAGVPLGENLLISEEARSYDLGTMEL